MRVFLHHKGPSRINRGARRAPPPGLDFPAVKVGTSPGGVEVWSANSLAERGKAVADACLALVDNDLSALNALFGTSPLSNVKLIVSQLSDQSDGSGGAYHWSCADTTLYCDCADGRPKRTQALFVAEAVECFSDLQGKGWDCGATNGEALSRTLAEDLYPGELDDYSTAAAWLDGGRPDWVSSNQADDTDPVSNGCGTLFLWWLRALGFGWQGIVQAARSSLAQTFYALTNRQAAFVAFKAACQAQWPAGRPSGVTVDNPWPTGGGGNGGGGGGNGGATGPIPVNLGGNAAAGDYLLTPVPPGLAKMDRKKLGSLLACFLACLSAGLSEK